MSSRHEYEARIESSIYSIPFSGWQQLYLGWRKFVKISRQTCVTICLFHLLLHMYVQSYILPIYCPEQYCHSVPPRRGSGSCDPGNPRDAASAPIRKLSLHRVDQLPAWPLSPYLSFYLFNLSTARPEEACKPHHNHTSSWYNFQKHWSHLHRLQ